MKQTQISKTAVLQSEPRKKLGSRTAVALRSLGRIPSSLEWTKEAAHVDFSIDSVEFLAARRRHQHVFELDFAGKKEAAIVRHIDWDTFGDLILHVEFRRVDLKKKTEVEVDLHFVGHPKGVLNQLVAHVKVMALPTEIPDELEVGGRSRAGHRAAGRSSCPNVDLVTRADRAAREIKISVDSSAPRRAPSRAAPVPARRCRCGRRRCSGRQELWELSGRWPSPRADGEPLRRGRGGGLLGGPALAALALRAHFIGAAPVHSRPSLPGPLSPRLRNPCGM
jgi:ribosomal protein L25 (general stress protein Ctc)